MIYIIIAIVLLIIVELYLFIKCDDPLLTFLSIIGIIIVTCLFIEVSRKSQPEAIDVYRGKTTLKITYENNVPIDTVVVFKNSK